MMKMMPQRAAILIGSVLLLLLSASQSVAEEKGKAAVLLLCFDLEFRNILDSISCLTAAAATDKLVVVTVATHITDGFQRFNRSVHLYGLKLEVSWFVLFCFVLAVLFVNKMLTTFSLFSHSKLRS